MSSGSALAVTRMIGMNGSSRSALSSLQTWMPSLPGIITSSRIRSGVCALAAISAASPSSASHHLVALAREPCLHDLEVGRVVVDHQDPRRLAHQVAPGAAAPSRCRRIIASSWRGLKGLAT